MTRGDSGISSLHEFKWYSGETKINDAFFFCLVPRVRLRVGLGCFPTFISTLRDQLEPMLRRSIAKKAEVSRFGEGALPLKPSMALSGQSCDTKKGTVCVFLGLEVPSHFLWGKCPIFRGQTCCKF